jgi:hypothetical protein
VKNNLETCPQAKFLSHQHCEAVLDTGGQCSVISEELCEELKFAAVNSIELPAQTIFLMRAFQGKTKRVKLQVMLELNFNWLLVDQGFLVAPCLMTRVLFGLFCCVR